MQYANSEIIVFLIAANIIVILAAVFILLVSRIQQKRKQLYQQQLLEKEYQTREKAFLQISMDLHDEVGSSLSGIHLFTQMAGEQLKLNNLVEAKQNIDKASAYSNEVIEKVSDMAWLLKPNNESISLLITKLKTYSKAAAGTKNIQLSFEVAPEFSMKELSLLQRKAIYLISKEAINNAVKYADCKNIYYNLHSNKDVLSLTIRDDGIGFSEEAINPGNGLQNMRARAAEINAEIDIHSETGTGTTIQLKLNTLN